MSTNDPARGMVGGADIGGPTVAALFTRVRGRGILRTSPNPDSQKFAEHERGGTRRPRPTVPLASCSLRTDPVSEPLVFGHGNRVPASATVLSLSPASATSPTAERSKAVNNPVINSSIFLSSSVAYLANLPLPAYKVVGVALSRYQVLDTYPVRCATPLIHPTARNKNSRKFAREVMVDHPIGGCGPAP